MGADLADRETHRMIELKESKAFMMIKRNSCVAMSSVFIELIV